MPTITSRRASGRQPFVADRDSLVHDTGHTIDWAAVGNDRRETPGQVVTVNGAHVAGATTLNVTALARLLPAGTVLDFGGDEFARTTADAAAGATTVPVVALAAALEGGEVATVPGQGSKFLPAGTVVGEAASGNGSLSPRVVTTNPAVGILATDAVEDDRNDSRSGYGLIRGGLIYGNLLPDGVPAAAVVTELNDAGTGFGFVTYTDDSAV